MIYTLKAPFESGVAGKLRVRNGVCKTDDEKLVKELTQPPHNFELAETTSELEEEPEDESSEDKAKRSKGKKQNQE